MKKCHAEYWIENTPVFCRKKKGHKGSCSFTFSYDFDTEVLN